MKAATIAISKKLAYIVAGLIILAAMLVAISRVVIPMLDKHRTDFEEWASQTLNVPVKIEKVRFSWYQYQPVITFHGVTLYSQKTNQPSFQIKRLRIFFSLIQSLRQKKIVLSGLMLSGSSATIDQSSSGEFSVRGLPSLDALSGQASSEMKLQDVLAGLSTQPRLMLRNIDIHYNSSNGQKRFVTIDNLRFDNDNAEHIVLGHAILHQELPTEISFVLRAQGEGVDVSKMNVKAYVYFSGLSLSQWANKTAWEGWHIKEGIGSAKCWLTWESGTLKKIQASFQLYKLQLLSDKDQSVHVINRLSGDAGWKRQGTSQVIAADDVLIDLPRHFWPTTNFYILLTPDAAGKLIPKTINLGYFNIRDSLSFLDASTIEMPPEIKTAITGLKLDGSLQNTTVTFADGSSDWHLASLQTGFNNISFLPWQAYPGVHNLTGTLALNNKQLDLTLGSEKLSFRYDPWFEHPVKLDLLKGSIQLEGKKDDNWVAKISGLQASSSDVNFAVDGSVTQIVKSAPKVDLRGTFNIPKMKNLIHYLPMRAFEPGLTEWLQDAFMDGHATNGIGVIQGSIADFPFDHGEGKFEVSTHVNDVELKYAPSWPVLKHVEADVFYAARKIDIRVASSDMMGIVAKNVTANIPALGTEAPTIAYVKTQDISADFSDGLKFLRASPLDKTIGRMFHDVEVSGPIVVNLDLTIPLINPDDTKVNGNIALSKVMMNLVPWQLQLSNMQGDVHFTENSTDATNLKGELFNKPLTLSLATIHENKKESFVRATTSNNLAVDDLEKWLKIPFSKVVKGSADVAARLDLSLAEPIQAHLASDLAGMSVDLPAPYAKSIKDKVKFTADITIAEKKPIRLSLNYNDILNAALILDNKNNIFHLTAADLRLGSGAAEWPKDDGLYITGNIDKLDLDQIKSYASQSSNADLPDLTFMGVDITAHTLNLFGQNLSQVRLQLIPNGSNYDVTISNRDISGKVQLPVNMNAKGVITAQFNKLNLTTSNNKSLDVIDLRTLPAINFSAGNMGVNRIPLGRVEFRVAPMGQGVSIKTLTINAPHMNLKAAGDWLQSGKNSNTTHLNGVLASTDVSALLTEFGYDLHNFISSKGTLTFDLSWPDVPYSPDMGALDGKATLDMGAGRIVEVGEASGAKMDLGRLLSIFSLQTIPRRLSGDFSDLSQKGYSFDSLRGEFNFDNGGIYTNNTRFDGPVAKVDINGRIGVKSKDVDLTLSVTPYVTSSLPIAATLISGPVIGLAALAVNTVVSSAVSQVTTYYYSVKGSWSNPQWSEIKSSGGSKRGG